jgi:V/A-type H+-transporting ATPase subunit K
MVANIRKMRPWITAIGLVMIGISLFAPAAFGQPEKDTPPDKPADLGSGIRTAGLAIGAGLALAGGALSTGRVQAAVSASGIGVLAEKREMLPLILILLAFPETLVVLGFVLAIMLMGKI